MLCNILRVLLSMEIARESLNIRLYHESSKFSALSFLYNDSPQRFSALSQMNQVRFVFNIVNPDGFLAADPRYNARSMRLSAQTVGVLRR